MTTALQGAGSNARLCAEARPAGGGAPLLSVFGGKITTFRKLAESAMEKMQPFFPGMGKPWTAAASLPGGDFAHAEVEERIADLSRTYSFFAPRNI